MRNFYITLNPHGGQQKGPKLLKQILPILENNGIKASIIETAFPGHARELAHQLDFDGYEGIIVIGGDGTMHEIVNGMLTRPDKKKLPIGLIPGGTGNSFLHDLNLTNPLEAINAIIDGNISKIDVAKLEMNNIIKYAFNIIGWGLVTDIGSKSERLRWLGEARYSLLSFFEVLKYKPRTATLVINDKKIKDDFTFIIACNTIHTGKGMKMAPKAKLNDGLIDLVVVRHGAKTSRMKLLSMLPKVYNGSHIKHPILEYYQVSEFLLIPDKDDILNIDGEILGSTPIKVKMLQGAFEVFR